MKAKLTPPLLDVCAVGAALSVAILGIIPFKAAGMVVRQTDNARIWQTVLEPSSPLEWPWHEHADSAVLSITNELTGSVSEVAVERGDGELRGSYLLAGPTDGSEGLHANYYDYEWVWAYDLMLRYYGLEEGKITYRDLVMILRRWRDSVLRLDRMLYDDAKKEFSLSAKTGFGFDGDGTTADADFEGVRGVFETNPFVAATTEHMKRKDALGKLWIDRLNALADHGRAEA